MGINYGHANETAPLQSRLIDGQTTLNRANELGAGATHRAASRRSADQEEKAGPGAGQGTTQLITISQNNKPGEVRGKSVQSFLANI